MLMPPTCAPSDLRLGLGTDEHSECGLERLVFSQKQEHTCEVEGCDSACMDIHACIVPCMWSSTDLQWGSDLPKVGVGAISCFHKVSQVVANAELYAVTCRSTYSKLSCFLADRFACQTRCMHLGECLSEPAYLYGSQEKRSIERRRSCVPC